MNLKPYKGRPKRGGVIYISLPIYIYSSIKLYIYIHIYIRVFRVNWGNYEA